MFSKKKEPIKKTGGGHALMAQMGFISQTGKMSFNDDDDDIENDDEIEAELLALQGEILPKSNNKKGKIKSAAELDKIIALSMKDINSDEEVSDTEDPDLLAELEELDASDEDIPTNKANSILQSPVSSNSTSSSNNLIGILEIRLGNYQEAIVQAKSTDDSSKVRRYDRGLKTLEDQIKKAKKGLTIPEEEIPPAIILSKNPAIKPQPPSQNNENITLSPQHKNEINSIVKPSEVNSIIPVQPSINTTENITYQPPVPKRPSMDNISKPTNADIINNTLKPKPSIPIPNKQLSPNTDHTKLQSSQMPPMQLPVPAQRNMAFSQQDILAMSDEERVNYMSVNRDQYKNAALEFNRAGKKEKAVEYLRIVKQFESVISAIKEGKPVDLSNMPQPLHNNTVQENKMKDLKPIYDVKQGHCIENRPNTDNIDIQMSDKGIKDLPKSIDLKTGKMMEALQERLAKYKESEQQAKTEDNSSKARRFGRIVKQYEDAIKLHRMGKPFDQTDLPAPPGFPPLPEANASTPANNQPQITQRPQAPSKQSLSSPVAPASGSTLERNISQNSKISPKPSMQKQGSNLYSRAEQQASFLEERQMQFKKAALQAKTSGDMELAKKYMRMAKGFDQMIDASKSGLPVDLSQIPVPPGSSDETGFVFVDASDVPIEISGDTKEAYKTLQDELLSQIKISETNRDHFTQLGDISTANKFDKMCQSSRKDLVALKNAFDHLDPVPRFHYETRQFSIVHCCTDLGDNDLEVTIIRGLNFNPPTGYSNADLHTYVKYEFPFPESNQVGETHVIRSTNSPEFNQTFKLEVNRKSRSFLRLLKSSKLFKFDIYYKRGFLKGDKILGSVQIKLQPLEDKCVYHDSYDLIENRKSVGGKLEVKIRVRDPFLNKQVEETKEKWLIIDQFLRSTLTPTELSIEMRIANDSTKPQQFAAAISKPNQPTQSSVQSSSSTISCISVLNYEKEQLEKQLERLKNNLKPADLETLKAKSQLLGRKSADLGKQLTSSGLTAMQAYVTGLRGLSVKYANEVKLSVAQKQPDKTQILLTKKTLVDKEIESMMRRLQGK